MAYGADAIAEASLPFTAFPEYEPLIKFLETQARDVFWTINAPGILSAGAVSPVSSAAFPE